MRLKYNPRQIYHHVFLCPDCDIVTDGSICPECGKKFDWDKDQKRFRFKT
ncbi:MAG: hypothetical protein ACXADY_02905 [Candidatus Hodarchaeales archaeon]|jgi:predicted RNA-binding protein with PUA domain